MLGFQIRLGGGDRREDRSTAAGSTTGAASVVSRCGGPGFRWDAMPAIRWRSFLSGAVSRQEWLFSISPSRASRATRTL